MKRLFEWFQRWRLIRRIEKLKPQTGDLVVIYVDTGGMSPLEWVRYASMIREAIQAWRAESGRYWVPMIMPTRYRVEQIPKEKAEQLLKEVIRHDKQESKDGDTGDNQTEHSDPGG